MSKTVESIHTELDSILDEIRQGRLDMESLNDAMGYLADSVRTFKHDIDTGPCQHGSIHCTHLIRQIGDRLWQCTRCLQVFGYRVGIENPDGSLRKKR